MSAPFVHSASKRILDAAGACILLATLAPVLGLVALCIWLDDGRPLLFTQTRVGVRGEPFRIFKFRTLTHEPADPACPGTHTIRIGDALRRWALDELPQLWNVLRGDMSLVGPRPTLPEQVEQYGPHERRRLRVRPGLTGWAQIHGRNALSWPTRIDLDVWYVRHQGLTLDLYILLHTPLTLVQGIGVTGAGGKNPSFSPASRSHA